MAKPADRVPELIRDWTEIASDELREQGVAVGQEDVIARKVISRICDAYAGVQFYLPIWTARRLTERDRIIAAAADAGTDIDALVKKFGLHATTIYAIIRRVKAVEIASRQQPLFDPE